MQLAHNAATRCSYRQIMRHNRCLSQWVRMMMKARRGREKQLAMIGCASVVRLTTAEINMNMDIAARNAVHHGKMHLIWDGMKYARSSKEMLQRVGASTEVDQEGENRLAPRPRALPAQLRRKGGKGGAAQNRNQKDGSIIRAPVQPPRQTPVLQCLQIPIQRSKRRRTKLFRGA